VYGFENKQRLFPYIALIDRLLGAFAALRKATNSFVMSVPMQQLGSHWTNFHEILYVGIFGKSVEKMQVSLRLDKNIGYST
jgi:hypothetical protein